MPGLVWQSAMVAAVQEWSPPGGEALARLLSHLGGEYLYLLLIPGLLWFARWELAVKAARAMVWADLLGEAIKWTLNWPRPTAALALEPSPGFVSTHAALSLAVAWVAGREHPRLRPWLACWVLGVGWSRLRLGVHFPLDVLGGWLLGVAVALLVCRWGKDCRQASYLSVTLGLLLAALWPEGGAESLQRDLGLLLGLELSLLQRFRGAPSSDEPPPRLLLLAGLGRLLALLAAYLGLKLLGWPRLWRYLILALIAAWRRPLEKEIS